MLAERDNVVDCGEGARCQRINGSGVSNCDAFCAHIMHFDRDVQFGGGGAQESAFSTITLDAMNLCALMVSQNYTQNDAGKSGPRSDVKPSARCWVGFPNRNAILNMPRPHLIEAPVGNKIGNPSPFVEQHHIRAQSFDASLWQRVENLQYWRFHGHPVSRETRHNLERSLEGDLPQSPGMR